jgi:manganese efflux pump family protein
MQLFLFGFVVGLDNMAIALAFGSLGLHQYKWRLILTFGLLAFVISLLGLWIGDQVSRYFEEGLNIIGGVLLAALGFWTLYSARDDEANGDFVQKAKSWAGIIMIGIGASIDKLVVGFNLGIRNQFFLPVAAIITLFVVTMAIMGMSLGKRAHKRWQRYSTAGAGFLLIGLAIASVLNWL